MTNKKSGRNAAKLADDIGNSIEAAVGYPPHFDDFNTATLSWRIGKLIADAADNLDSERAKTMIKSATTTLFNEYGNIYSYETLCRMAKFASVFPSYETVVTLTKHLTWEHFSVIIDIEDSVQREFYTWSCMIKKWSVEKLRAQINGRLYENTALEERATLDSIGRTIDDSDDILSPNSNLFELLSTVDRLDADVK